MRSFVNFAILFELTLSFAVSLLNNVGGTTAVIKKILNYSRQSELVLSIAPENS